MSAGGTSIRAVLERRQILVTCGTGGVGKTTLSAAMSVLGALAGKRTVVITIDPAKRLATSLGLDALGDHPTDLTEQVRAAARRIRPDLAGFQGTLEAIIPDTTKTFEEFVRGLASSPAVADRVIKNPIFQIFAKEFSGTNEYMAMEKLFAIAKSGRYDCIVLDTPPSRNTLAFLDAPMLMARLFEEKLIRWVAVPANKLMAVGMKKTLSLLERLTGQGFMVHMVEFFAALLEVQAGFSANLQEVIALLESDRVGYLMVAAPSPETAPDSRAFIDALHAHRMHFDGILINRTLGDLHDEPGDTPALDLMRALQRRERGIVGEICGKQASLCAQLPELARDVHSVEDLFHVAMAFGA